jgi:hypothetical protein
MTTLTTMTKLEAVNLLLLNIGQSPVTSITPASGETIASLGLDVQNAVSTLDETSREVQARGGKTNREYKVTLTPSSGNIITIGSDIVAVDLDHFKYSRADYDVSIRTGKLYNHATNSYTWTEGIEVMQTRLFDFADLPHHLAWYITVRAARKMTDRTDGSATGHRFGREDEIEAQADYAKNETDIGNRNFIAHRRSVGLRRRW